MPCVSRSAIIHLVDEEIVEKLLALNRQFYAAFARPFAASRSPTDPALTSILPHIPERARVLDVGCGNGRLALLLDCERPGTRYVGVDALPELIELARAQRDEFGRISAEFHVLDITRPGWSGGLFYPGDTEDTEKAAASTEKSPVLRETSGEHRVLSISAMSFDCVVCLAVLHHIPSFGLRARVLREAAGLLAPGGHLVLSTWQFLDSPRQRRKIVDWSKAGIPEQALEPGDYLLDWKRGGQGMRYCHLVDQAEIERLADETGLRVFQTFRAGGREGDLSLFAVLDREAAVG